MEGDQNCVLLLGFSRDDSIKMFRLGFAFPQRVAFVQMSERVRDFRSIENLWPPIS